MFTGHPAPHQARQPAGVAAGFTLIEVMIVVAIVAILSSVALPAYNNYIRRGQLQEAFTNLANYRIKLEQYYQDNRRYAADTDATACGGAASAEQLTAAELGGEIKHFTYGCTVSADTTTGLAAQHYVITATGNTGSNVAGYVYTMDDAGNKATTQFGGTTASVNCWATKSAGDCS